MTYLCTFQVPPGWLEDYYHPIDAIIDTILVLSHHRPLSLVVGLSLVIDMKNIICRYEACLICDCQWGMPFVNVTCECHL